MRAHARLQLTRNDESHAECYTTARLQAQPNIDMIIGRAHPNRTRRASTPKFPQRIVMARDVHKCTQGAQAHLNLHVTMQMCPDSNIHEEC
jgi:hypothetical protein